MPCGFRISWSNQLHGTHVLLPTPFSVVQGRLFRTGIEISLRFSEARHGKESVLLASYWSSLGRDLPACYDKLSDHGAGLQLSVGLLKIRRIDRPERFTKDTFGFALVDPVGKPT